MAPIPFELFTQDAVSWLASRPGESVDLVITDPAYESLEKHRAIGTTTRLKHSKSSSNDWFKIFPNARFGELFREIYRVLRKDTHFYLLCDAETMFVAKPEAELAGFKFWKPLVWDKATIGMGYHYRARYEFILFFEKGKRRLNDLGIADIILVPRIRGGYPAEKPAEVAERGHRGGAARAALSGQRSESRSRADCRASAARVRRRARAAGYQYRGAARSAGSPRLDRSAHMTGAEYANLVASYVSNRFGSRTLKVYREIRIGKTIIGKNRCIDIFCVAEDSQRAFAIECKFQDSQGTVDEKIPYALEDLLALPMAGCIAYAGQGFSDGVRHMLAASRHAAYCLPTPGQIETTTETRELDHVLAVHFGWWDVLIEKKRPV